MFQKGLTKHQTLGCLAVAIKNVFELEYNGTWQCAIATTKGRKWSAWTAADVENTFVKMVVADIICEVWKVNS